MVYLSIGSNEGDPSRNVEVAIELIGLKEGVTLLRQGGVYETEPQGKREQAWFVNTAVMIETDLSPERLLTMLQGIEREMGREKREKWSSRVIDIDILFYNNKIVNTKKLSIPHKRAHERRFVMGPIADINPDFIHPVSGRSVMDILAAIPAMGQAMRRIGL